MNSYYVSWYTWHMGEVSTPWDFWYLSKGNKYKPLRPDVPEWDPISTREAFLKGDEQVIQKMNQNYMPDVKLMAFVPAHDAHHAEAQVKQFFPDAEFDKVTLVDEVTQNQILLMIQETISKAKR